MAASYKIEATFHSPSTTPNSPLRQPSQPPSGDSVNQDLASPCVSRLSASPANIPKLDYTSFTTDHQQTWLSQPPSRAASASTLSQQDYQDFPLYPDHQAIPSLLSSGLRKQATLNTLPRTSPSQHLRVSTVQNQATSYGQHSSSNTIKPRSSSTPSLQSQQIPHQRVNRLRTSIPQPPLFNSTPQHNQIHVLDRRIHSAPNFQQGNMATAFDHISFSAGDFGADDQMFDFDYTNGFTAVNQSGSSNGQTVSPHELLMSAPGSAQFGLLDTPESSFLDSPMPSSAYNTTPLEDGSLDHTLDYNDLKHAQPLFSDADAFAHPQIDESIAMEYSPALHHVQPILSSAASPMVRQKSSPGRPPISGNIHSRKHSLNSGIVKSNSKSRKSLPEIEINSEDDKETAKRKKNTAAARKSRMRKQEDLEYLTTENQRLRTIIMNLGGNPD